MTHQPVLKFKLHAVCRWITLIYLHTSLGEVPTFFLSHQGIMTSRITRNYINIFVWNNWVLCALHKSTRHWTGKNSSASKTMVISHRVIHWVELVGDYFAWRGQFSAVGQEFGNSWQVGCGSRICRVFVDSLRAIVLSWRCERIKQDPVLHPCMDDIQSVQFSPIKHTEADNSLICFNSNFLFCFIFPELN